MIHLCDYGCGQEAKYQLKNGKWCCSENIAQCSFMRKEKSGEKNPMFGKHQSKKHRDKIGKKLRTPFEEIIRFVENEEWELLSKEEYYKNQFSYLWFRCPEGHEYPARWDLFKAGQRCRKCADKKHSQWMKINGQVTPNYNPKACKRIIEYGEEHGYNFQHAENGGEYQVLRYWVDGYDKEKNVVIEVDEPHHYDKEGNLKEKDVLRQKEITDFLSCKFIRLRI